MHLGYFPPHYFPPQTADYPFQMPYQRVPGMAKSNHSFLWITFIWPSPLIKSILYSIKMKSHGMCIPHDGDLNAFHSGTSSILHVSIHSLIHQTKLHSVTLQTALLIHSRTWGSVSTAPPVLFTPEWISIPFRFCPLDVSGSFYDRSSCLTASLLQY